jgi:YHS domain-containing protein
MNSKSKNLGTITLFIAVVLLIAIVTIPGFKKKEAAPAAAAPRKQVTSETVEQTTCPVMGRVIDKKIYTEYKGKKVYFCCKECLEKFKAEPEKYLTNCRRLRVSSQVTV